VEEREARIKIEREREREYPGAVAVAWCSLIMFRCSAQHKSKGRTPEIFAANDIVRVREG
jgi:hypothetical protein